MLPPKPRRRRICFAQMMHKTVFGCSEITQVAAKSPYAPVELLIVFTVGLVNSKFMTFTACFSGDYSPLRLLSFTSLTS